jgi:hypothetical protein
MLAHGLEFLFGCFSGVDTELTTAKASIPGGRAAHRSQPHADRRSRWTGAAAFLGAARNIRRSRGGSSLVRDPDIQAQTGVLLTKTISGKAAGEARGARQRERQSRKHDRNLRVSALRTARSALFR